MSYEKINQVINEQLANTGRVKNSVLETLYEMRVKDLTEYFHAHLPIVNNTRNLNIKLLGYIRGQYD